MIRIGLGLTVALLAWVPAQAADPFEIPVRLSSENHLLVDTYINEEGPFPFIVDSAASGTLVFDRLRARADLPQVEEEGTITVQAASGPVDAEVVTFGEFRMGEGRYDIPFTLSLATGDGLADSAFGIVGADVLYRQPVGFALSEGRLQLYPEGVAIDPDADLQGDWFRIELSHRGAEDGPAGFYWTEVSVNGVAIPALIDTGTQRSTLNTAAAVAAGFDPDNHALTSELPLSSASRDTVDALNFPVSTMQLGERIWAARSLALADLPVFDLFGDPAEPVMVLGSDYLAEQDFIIDPIGNALWVQHRRSAALGGLTRRPTTENSSARN